MCREFAPAQNDDRKWVVFDGPIDTLWMESMNTVLDNNKNTKIMRLDEWYASYCRSNSCYPTLVIIQTAWFCLIANFECS